MNFKQSILALSVALGSISTFAATDGQTTYRHETGNSIASGVRVGLITSGPKIKGSSGNHSASLTSDQSLGISIGSATIKNGAVGFISEFSYTSLQFDDVDGNLNQQMLQFGATYGVSPEAFLMGGLNLGKFTGSNDIDTDWGIGMQLGVGYQVARNIGIHTKYYQMNTKTSNSSGTTNLVSSALELGLSVNF